MKLARHVSVPEACLSLKKIKTTKLQHLHQYLILRQYETITYIPAVTYQLCCASGAKLEHQ